MVQNAMSRILVGEDFTKYNLTRALQHVSLAMWHTLDFVLQGIYYIVIFFEEYIHLQILNIM